MAVCVAVLAKLHNRECVHYVAITTMGTWQRNLALALQLTRCHATQTWIEFGDSLLFPVNPQKCSPNTTSMKWPVHKVNALHLRLLERGEGCEFE
jgi:hypothetical protein